MKCDKCGKRLEVFDEDYLICKNEKCSSYGTMWDRLVPKDRDN